MENANPSEDPSKQTPPAIGDEIPLAQRDGSNNSTSSNRFNREFWLLGGTAVAIAIIAGGFVAWGTSPVAPTADPSPTAEIADATADSTTEPTEPVDGSETRPAAPANSSDEALLDDTLLGHLPYEEAPADTLRPVLPDGSILLREAAAEKFLAMVEAAAADGIDLVPVSGFRSIEDQEYLFFDVKAERGEEAATRAEVSAPPGYSEHHTGYAIDIVDGSRPEIGLVEAFETTPAFQWLQENAAFYSFELSFPRNNAQGINYEPWHWRFVGDRHSLETFYRASQLAPVSPSPAPTPPASP